MASTAGGGATPLMDTRVGKRAGPPPRDARRDRDFAAKPLKAFAVLQNCKICKMLILQFGLTGGYARWFHIRAAARFRFRAVRVQACDGARARRRRVPAAPRARGVARGMRRRGHNYGLGGKLGAEELAESAASSSIGMGSLEQHPQPPTSVCLFKRSRWLWPAGCRHPTQSRSDGMPGLGDFNLLRRSLAGVR